MKKFLLLIVWVMLLMACQAIPDFQQVVTKNPSPTSIAFPASQTPENLNPMLSLIQNAEYHSMNWGDFQLVNGIYYRTPSSSDESPELYSTMLFQQAFGDLNTDGIEDAAVILQTHNGGNGDSKELAAVISHDGKVENISTVYIGSMVAVENLQIRSGVIIIDLRVHGPNDGLCCPSQKVTYQFSLVNNQLIQLP